MNGKTSIKQKINKNEDMKKYEKIFNEMKISVGDFTNYNNKKKI